MNRIIFVSGGCRSGKSGMGIKLSQQSSEERIFIATSPRLDGEMNARIKKHEVEREGLCFKVIEEEIHLSKALSSLQRKGEKTVVVDCISLWINNLMYRQEQNKTDLSEEIVREITEEIIDAAEGIEGTVIFVSSEVGLGLVPGDAVSRRYRDYLGVANQVIARAAQDVYFMVSGLPMTIKGKNR